MSEFAPVRTVADLESLDDDEILAGYLYAMHGGTDEPGSDKSRSFWHGWRNGMVDRRNREPDAAQCALAAEMYGPAKRAGMN